MHATFEAIVDFKGIIIHVQCSYGASDWTNTVQIAS